jgi:hypothetical protein
VQLHKQLTKPVRLCHAVDHSALLHLSARTRDDILTLRGPEDEVVTQEHRVAQSSLASIKTADPSSISVDDEVRCRSATKKQAVAKGALEVLEDALHDREIWVYLNSN